MKKQSTTTTVYRIELVKGNYTTIARQTLLNPNLTDSSKTLLQLCLNNVDGWTLSLEYYKDKLKWSNDKMAGAVENLITNGYMTKEKLPRGAKGFKYKYVISELGNLNPNKEQPCLTDIELSIDESAIMEQNRESIQLETETSIEEIMQEPIESVNDSDWLIDVLGGLFIKIKEDFNPSDEYLGMLYDYWIKKIESQNLNRQSFDSEMEYQAVKRNLEKKKQDSENARPQIIAWIDFHNSRGTKDQRANIKLKAIRYFDDNFKDRLHELKEGDVSTRLLYLKSSIVDANRVYDSKYQD